MVSTLLAPRQPRCLRQRDVMWFFGGQGEGRTEPCVNVQEVLPLTAGDLSAQIKTCGRRWAWLKLLLRLPEPVLLLAGALPTTPG